jgi:hypothetical protein
MLLTGETILGQEKALIHSLDAHQLLLAVESLTNLESRVMGYTFDAT